MRIRDWSSDVCSSDLHNVQSGREFGTSRRQCFGEALKLLIDAVRFLFECVRDDTGGELALLAQFLELADRHVAAIRDPQIGRASCRERVCRYVKISVVAVSLKKKISHMYMASRCEITNGCTYLDQTKS